jgi:hypothetical protein
VKIIHNEKTNQITIERKISGLVPQKQSGFSGAIQGVEIEVAFARQKPQRIRYSPDGHQTKLNDKYGVTQDVEEIRSCVVIRLLMH